MWRVIYLNSLKAKESQSSNQYVNISRTKSTGVAKIGGPFALKDHNGKAVTDKTYRGQYMLVYFGYTFCPDICPTALHNLTQALNMLPRSKLNRLVPIFISIDPERDTTEQLKLYKQNFHDKFVMLTGDAKSVKSAARAYKAYYAKARLKREKTLIIMRLIILLLFMLWIPKVNSSLTLVMILSLTL